MKALKESIQFLRPRISTEILTGNYHGNFRKKSALFGTIPF